MSLCPEQSRVMVLTVDYAMTNDFSLPVSLHCSAALLFCSGAQVNFLPPHLLSFDFELRRASPVSTSLSPFVRHLASLMLLILAIGAVTHWAALHGKTKAVMGSAVLLLVGGVWLLPMLYGPRYLRPEDLQGAGGGSQQDKLLSFDGNLDSAYDSLIPKQKEDDDDDEGDDEADDTDNCISDGSDAHANSSTALLLSGGLPLLEGKQQPFVSFFGRHVPLREVMCHWRSYVMMLMFMCISGSGLLVINNVQVGLLCLCVM